MGLTTNGSTGFYFESKIIERSLEIKNNMLFNFQELFQKCTFLILWHFFSVLVLIQSTQFLSDNTNLEDSCLWWSIFPVNYQNANGDQTCIGGDILRGSSTYKFARHINELVLWGHVTKKTYIHWQKTYEHQTTKLCKVLTYFEGLLLLKTQNALITRLIWPFTKICDH